MKHACTSAVVVAGKDCGVAGIFTERDVVKAIRAGMDVSRTPISAVMTRDPICVTGDTEDLAAMRIMAQRRFRHLPVVESEDRPVLIGLHDSLQLGKSLLQSGSRSIMSRAKTFLKTLFATRESHGLLSEELSASLHTVVKEKASSLAVSSNATVAKALEIMTDMQSSALLVKTPRRPAEIEGIFTERDLVSRVVALHKDPQVTTLADVMTKEPECIDAGASVEDALMKMVSKGYRHLPIQRSDGRVIGLMDVAQLIQRIASSMPGFTLESSRNRSLSISSDSGSFCSSTSMLDDVPTTPAPVTPEAVSVASEDTGTSTTVELPHQLHQVLKQAFARMTQGQHQLSQMNFSGAQTRVEHALKRIRDVVPAIIEHHNTTMTKASAYAVLTAQAVEVKLLSQRSHIASLEGCSSDAISDAKEAIAAMRCHLQTISDLSAKLGITITATTVPQPTLDDENAVPVCVLDECVLAKLQFQLCSALIQACEFKELTLVAVELLTSGGPDLCQQLLHTLESEVVNIVDAAEELQADSEPLEAVRSYGIVEQGCVAFKALVEASPAREARSTHSITIRNIELRVWLNRAQLQRANGNTAAAMQDIQRCKAQHPTSLKPYAVVAQWHVDSKEWIRAYGNANQGIGAAAALGSATGLIPCDADHEQSLAALNRIAELSMSKLQEALASCDSKENRPLSDKKTDVSSELASLAALMSR